MQENQRIKNQKIHIDDRQVKQFFDDRIKKQLPYLLNYTNYQDNHPQLALERDKYEKQKIEPFLNLQSDSMVLDIGCGVGRWGKHILSKISSKGCYTGVDYSGQILNLARENLEKSMGGYSCFYVKDVFKTYVMFYQKRILRQGMILF